MCNFLKAMQNMRDGNAAARHGWVRRWLVMNAYGMVLQMPGEIPAYSRMNGCDLRAEDWVFFPAKHARQIMAAPVMHT
jgi:hypothetical protein